MTPNLSAKSLLRRLALAVLPALLLTAALILPAFASAGAWQNYPAVGATSGGEFAFTQGGADLALGSEGDSEAFVSLSVGGYVLSQNVYTVSSGACTVTVKGNYLSTFPPGAYPVRFVFTDGETNATLTVAAADPAAPAASTAPPASSAPDPSASSTAPPASSAPPAVTEGPYTGVNTLLLGFTALSGGALAVFGLGKKWIK